ncbi:MAG: hypothetical protein GXO30_09120 [Epsilonproteobacteria bacterium]|nr:hypothetical protein [Campylobacterota bacterium]
MLKSFISILFLSSMLLSSHKSTGCELSQYGDVSLNIGSKEFSKVSYKPIAKSGKNFRSILVGSVISTDMGNLKIIDIKADKKRLNHKRVGDIKVAFKKDGFVEVIPMRYSYFKGYFSASGLDKGLKKVGFSLHIKALLCSAKPLKSLK